MMPNDCDIKLFEAATYRAQMMTEDMGLVSPFNAIGDDKHIEMQAGDGVPVFGADTKNELNLRYLGWRIENELDDSVLF
jgi:hypothetical protein